VPTAPEAEQTDQSRRSTGAISDVSSPISEAARFGGARAIFSSSRSRGAEKRTQSGRERCQKGEHRRMGIRTKYNSCRFRHFEVFEKHHTPVSGGTGAAESTEEPVHQQDQVSTTDPDSTYATKVEPRPGSVTTTTIWWTTTVRDCGVQATAARMSQETVAAQDMILGSPMARTPSRVGGCGCHLRQRRVPAVADGANITPYMRTRDNALRKNNHSDGPERFYLSTRKTQLSLSGWGTA